MTYLFTNIRISVYLFTGALSATVLGFAAYFATLFLPHIHRDYTIFALIVPSVTIFVLGTLLIMTHLAQPRFEVVSLFVLSILWLALGAWTVDRRDFLSADSDCSSWGIQQIVTKHGTSSAQTYCHEMKVVETFSWMNFGIFAIFMVIILILASNSRMYGRPYAWREPMLELGWFGELPGYSGGNYSSFPAINQMQPGMMMQPGMGMPMAGTYGPGGGYVIQQNPGHSVVIQPGPHGEAPRVTQVPGIVSTL